MRTKRTRAVSETLPFTLVDFVACDRRYAEAFRPRAAREVERQHGAGVGILVGADRRSSDKVPCLLMVDRNNVLQKVIVDDWLLREARRCAEMWRSLQELGGIHNSHAAKTRSRANARRGRSSRNGSRARTAKAPVGAAPERRRSRRSSGGTQRRLAAERRRKCRRTTPISRPPRCTSCNECTQINDKMFAYDANKQASIVNPDAGTYRQLVEAAESCQVSIIHPGKPRNPNEPGLEELLKRAEPFL